jgi:hypothetical protein
MGLSASQITAVKCELLFNKSEVNLLNKSSSLAPALGDEILTIIVPLIWSHYVAMLKSLTSMFNKATPGPNVMKLPTSIICECS